MDAFDIALAIDTPERVRFRHRLAGPGQRALAWGIDLMLKLVIGFAFALVAGLAGIVLEGAAMGLILISWFVLNWWYGALFEAFQDGQTPGKRAMGLRVIRADGAPIRAADALLRNLLRGVDGLPVGYALGGLCMLGDRWMRRIGDLAAGTVVVAEAQVGLVEPIVIDPPITEAERHDLPVRVMLSRDERTTIEELLRRRPRLSPGRAEELARLLAPRITERTTIEGSSALRTLALAWARATDRDR